MDTPESVYECYCKVSTFYFQKERGAGWGMSHKLIFQYTSSLGGSRNKYCHGLVFKYASVFFLSLTPRPARAFGKGEDDHPSVDDGRVSS